MNKYRNRHGDTYWFENIAPNQYRFHMDGNSMQWCRFGGHEMQEKVDRNDLGMFDPSGGPYVSIDTELPIGKVKHIKSTDDGIVITVE